MKMEKKMELVEQETIALLAYMDSRELRADIGVSALVSVLLTAMDAIDVPIETIVEAMRDAHTIRNQLYRNEDKPLH